MSGAPADPAPAPDRATAESADAGDARVAEPSGGVAARDLRRRPIPWTRVAVQMAAIVFSVLLALVLDDWRQSRDEQRLVESVELALLVELEGNQRLLEARLPAHEAMLDTLGVGLARQISGGESDAAGGFRPPSLDELGFDGLEVDASFGTSAWEAARATEAVTRMPLDQLFLLAGAYTIQADLQRAADRLRDKYDTYLLAVLDGERPTFAVVSFTSALSDLIAAERLLCERYRMLAPRLSGAEPGPAGRCGSGAVEIR